MRKYHIDVVIFIFLLATFSIVSLCFLTNEANTKKIYSSFYMPPSISITPINTTNSIELYDQCVLGWDVQSDTDVWITYQLTINESLVYSYYEHFIVGTITITYNFANDISALENLTIATYGFKLNVLGVTHTYLINLTNQSPNITATRTGTFEASPNENTHSYIQWTAVDPNVSYKNNAPYSYRANYTVINETVSVLKNGTWNSSIPIRFYPFMDQYATYNFTIIMNDGFGNTTEHTVNVTTVNLPPRFSKTQSNIILEYNESYIATWIVNDPSAFETRTYQIYRGNDVIETGTWTHMQTISYDFSEVVSSDTITIIVFDGTYSANSSFTITVESSPPPVSPEEPNTWVIVGVTIGGVGAAGVGGFYGYRFIRKKRCLPPNQWLNNDCVVPKKL